MPDKAAIDMPAPTDAPTGNGPALSATSDAPDARLAPAVSEERIPESMKTKAAANAKPEKTEETGKEATGAEETGTQPAAEEAAKGNLKFEDLPPWYKAQFTKSRNAEKASAAALRESNAKADAAQANLKKTLELVEKLTGENATATRKKITEADPRPKRETFDDPNAYEAALIDWAGRTAAATAAAEATAKIEAERTKEKEEKQADELAVENRKTMAAFAKRKATFLEDHPDYEDIAEAEPADGGPTITIAMAAVIMNDDDGPAIAYYLGQNPDESVRIADLSPVRQAAELGRIAARLNAKPAPATKPAPITPLKSGAANASRKGPNEESMDEYGARRTGELMAKRRPFIGTRAAPH